MLLTAGLGLMGTMRYDTPYWRIALFMALMGLGVGMMMQNLVLCTQNQVAPSDLVTASSVVTFFRSLGGAVGISVLGSVMSSRISHYAADTIDTLGPKDRAAAAQASGGGAIPNMDLLPPAIRTWLESAYGHGIADIFLYVAPIALLGFLVTLFIKEVPLRTAGALAQATEAQAAGGPAGGPAEAPARNTARRLQASRRGHRSTAAEEAPKTGSPPARTPEAADRETAQPGGAAAVAHARPPGGVRRRRHPGARLVPGAASAPVPQAAVTLISLAGRQLGRSVAQADGSYAVDAPGTGAYVLIASADGHQPQASTIVVNDEPVSYDILLGGTGAA
ncbi:EmrB/QacA subfamily drug resistance transporter OS=Streptomyces griseomycini OX=66895 GN=FHS37_001857 PE=4 SV=1 [Streptomyces griseomycini]